MEVRSSSDVQLQLRMPTKTFLPVTNKLHFRSSWFGNRLAT